MSNEIERRDEMPCTRSSKQQSGDHSRCNLRPSLEAIDIWLE